MIFYVWHMTKAFKSTGGFFSQGAQIEAESAKEALEKHRKQLDEAGYETAGGKTCTPNMD